jgi:hypothetical protein
MKTLYGKYGDLQFSEYKDKLHNKIFWLLIYKDPKTSGDYQNVDFDKYFVCLMKELNGLNDILLNPPKLIEMMSLLQAAYNETKSPEYSYKVYRKFILDAHNVLDEIKEAEV